MSIKEWLRYRWQAIAGMIVVALCSYYLWVAERGCNYSMYYAGEVEKQTATMRAQIDSLRQRIEVLEGGSR